eukprot:746657-Hanusia_phi.AAC.2
MNSVDTVLLESEEEDTTEQGKRRRQGERRIRGTGREEKLRNERDDTKRGGEDSRDEGERGGEGVFKTNDRERQA